MSHTKPMHFDTASALAQALVKLLQPACNRIEIAGSIRREKGRNGGEGPSDIEIVCVPIQTYRHLFAFSEKGASVASKPLRNELDSRCDDLSVQGLLEPRLGPRGGKAWGPRLKRAVFIWEGQVAPADLFSVLAPATWGVIFALRTGPGDFNKLLVRHAHALSRKVAGGQVWHSVPQEQLHLPSAAFLRFAHEASLGTIATNTEGEFFRAAGVPCWAPPERTLARLRDYLR